MGDEKVTSKSGATSSEIPGFHRIPRQALLRLASRMDLGTKKHGEGNWKKGIKDHDYVIERAGHVIDHAYKLIAKLKGELPWNEDDDAGAIIWGGMFLCEATKELHFEQKERE